MASGASGRFVAGDAVAGFVSGFIVGALWWLFLLVVLMGFGALGAGFVLFQLMVTVLVGLLEAPWAVAAVFGGLYYVAYRAAKLDPGRGFLWSFLLGAVSILVAGGVLALFWWEEAGREIARAILPH